MSNTELYKEIKEGDYTVSIYYDESAENPRDCWDCMSKIAVGKNCRCIKNELADFEPTGNFDIDAKVLKNKFGAVVIKPLYAYQHGGLSVNTTGFACKWDSCQLGYVIVTREDLLKSFNRKRLSKKIIHQGEKVIIAEMRIFDQYLRGDVYRFTVKDGVGNILDNCGGYYGDEEIKAIEEDASAAISIDMKNNTLNKSV